MGKIDEAVAELTPCSTGKDREIHLTIAQVYEKGKRFSEMGKELDAAEQLSSPRERKQKVIFMRGAMFERMKKYDAAEAEFARCWMPIPKTPAR